MGHRIALPWLTVAMLAVQSEAVAAPIQLSVKPSLCIVDDRNRSCRMTILVVWKADNAGSYCLHNELGAEPIGCWSDQTTGRFEEARAVETRLRYWLTQSGSDDAVAEASIEVMNAQPGDRRETRRRRHAWSIL
jgi:hypothetical protein